MTYYDRKVISLTQFDVGKPPEDDRGPVVPCPAEGLEDDVCNEPNCSRDCIFLKALVKPLAA
ncbi:hypothetical protein [Sphingomonas sp. LK11]|jgi:hypothetical protein|uniref:hypothetical protein n=1 Tax=Sphingomonas sp. LK11 TaxID=1390395 RepID=UPI0012EB34CE|nr:hypothetical protein [Sphingomonas sp. LK11]